MLQAGIYEIRIPHTHRIAHTACEFPQGMLCAVLPVLEGQYREVDRKASKSNGEGRERWNRTALITERHSIVRYSEEFFRSPEKKCGEGKCRPSGRVVLIDAVPDSMLHRVDAPAPDIQPQDVQTGLYHEGNNDLRQ